MKSGGKYSAVHRADIAALLEQVAHDSTLTSDARVSALEGVCLHDRARGRALAEQLSHDADSRVAAAGRSFARMMRPK